MTPSEAHAMIEEVRGMWLAVMQERTGLSGPEILSVIDADHEFWQERPRLAVKVSLAQRFAQEE